MNESHPRSGADCREALFNDRATGLAHAIQVPVERVTRLHGILFDLDPRLLIPGNKLFPPADDTQEFYQGIRPVLERHTLARSAEVRSSGTGLHLILWLKPAVELTSAADQQHWNAIIRAVQCTLPVDTDAPGMTALTRPVGSINTKNGAAVEVLKAGEPVEAKAVEDFMARLVESYFKEVALPLLGEQRVQPCPVCRREGTRLDLGDKVGFCYGSCSKVNLEQLYDLILKPTGPATPPSGEEPGPTEPIQIPIPKRGMAAAKKSAAKELRTRELCLN